MGLDIFSIKKRRATKQREADYAANFEELKHRNAERVEMLAIYHSASSQQQLVRPKTLTSLRDLTGQHCGVAEMVN